MASLPNELKLSDMSIPGTHDTMTSHKWTCYSVPWCGTQSRYLDDQLNDGIRFIDIRMRHYQDTLPIYHDFIYLGVYFTDVLKIVRQFLISNPRETVILSYQTEHTPGQNTKPFMYAFEKGLDSIEARYFWLLNIVPTLGQARGKIIFLNFRHVGWYGITKFSYSTVENCWANVIYCPLACYIKDKYYEGLIRNIKNSQRIESVEFYITYFSGNDAKKNFVYGTPRQIASRVNKKMYGYLRNNRRNGNFGVVVMDYPSTDLINTIYAKNRQPLKKPHSPKSS